MDDAVLVKWWPHVHIITKFGAKMYDKLNEKYFI